MGGSATLHTYPESVGSDGKDRRSSGMAPSLPLMRNRTVFPNSSSDSFSFFQGINIYFSLERECDGNKMAIGTMQIGFALFCFDCICSAQAKRKGKKFTSSLYDRLPQSDLQHSSVLLGDLEISALSDGPSCAASPFSLASDHRQAGGNNTGIGLQAGTPLDPSMLKGS